MCAFIIIVIMIALVLLIPTGYMMGVARGAAANKQKAESATGGKDVAATAVVGASTVTTTVTSPASPTGAVAVVTAPAVKCSKCEKYRICASHPNSVFNVFC